MTYSENHPDTSLVRWIHPNVFNAQANYVGFQFFSAFFLWKIQRDQSTELMIGLGVNPSIIVVFGIVYLDMVFSGNLKIKSGNIFQKVFLKKMEVEQRLRGRIVRRPKEQVWMLKTDSVIPSWTRQNFLNCLSPSDRKIFMAYPKL